MNFNKRISEEMVLFICNILRKPFHQHFNGGNNTRNGLQAGDDSQINNVICYDVNAQMHASAITYCTAPRSKYDHGEWCDSLNYNRGVADLNPELRALIAKNSTSASQ